MRTLIMYFKKVNQALEQNDNQVFQNFDQAFQKCEVGIEKYLSRTQKYTMFMTKVDQVF